jgi:hypothetical protein
MRLVLQFDMNADIIDVPQIVIDKKDILYDRFFFWLYDQHNNHKYWVNNKEKSKYGVCYRSDAFIEWLNKKVLKESEHKAKLLSEYICDYSDDLPILYF